MSQFKMECIKSIKNSTLCFFQVNSFDQPDANQNQMGFLPPDDLNGHLHLNGHPPNSVSSELTGPPSELSSPLSQ